MLFKPDRKRKSESQSMDLEALREAVQDDPTLLDCFFGCTCNCATCPVTLLSAELSEYERKLKDEVLEDVELDYEI